MDKFDRIVRLHAILRSRKTAISFEDLRLRLECSRSTLHRALNALRDRLHAPVVFDKDADGYRYEDQQGAGPFELPGLWFTPAELQALGLMKRLLSEVGGGLLEEHLSLLAKRLDELTRHRRLNLGEAASRLRFPSIAARPAGVAFQLAASATLQRKQVRISYYGRSRNEHTVRTISPQRVTYYRGSWYLDAWDEVKHAHRSFSIDRIESIELLSERATDISEKELDTHYASAYGIFSGQADQLAVFLFTAERSRWVADEQWHPQQVGIRHADGSFELRIPYRDHRELVMDILRHGPHVRVIEPESLWVEVQSQLRQALSQYTRDRN